MVGKRFIWMGTILTVSDAGRWSNVVQIVVWVGGLFAVFVVALDGVNFWMWARVCWFGQPKPIVPNPVFATFLCVTIGCNRRCACESGVKWVGRQRQSYGALGDCVLRSG